MIDQATAFVMSRIDNRTGTRADGESAAIPTEYELPRDAVREAVVNAVCHRDHTSNGSVQVMLFRNRLEVWNPGQLPYGLTVQKLFGPHKSIPANPLIADPKFWVGYVEKVGTGTEDIVNQCKGKGIKIPEYHQEEDFRVVIWRSGDPGVLHWLRSLECRSLHGTGIISWLRWWRCLQHICCFMKKYYHLYAEYLESLNKKAKI